MSGGAVTGIAFLLLVVIFSLARVALEANYQSVRGGLQGYNLQSGWVATSDEVHMLCTGEIRSATGFPFATNRQDCPDLHVNNIARLLNITVLVMLALVAALSLRNPLHRAANRRFV